MLLLSLKPAVMSLLLLMLVGTTIAQEATESTGKSPQPAGAAVPASEPVPSPATGVRRALIICGLAGDADHRKQFGESVELVHTGLTRYHGFQSPNIRVLWGEKPTEKDPESVRGSRDITTRESIAATAQAIRGELAADDTLWVIVISHAHYDGKNCWLNLAGTDLNQAEFGKLFTDLKCREQVFMITTACSGYYLKPLAQAGRVVITATEADLEVNETLFPQKLARAIGSPPVIINDLDVDRDGRYTLYDLYLYTARETAVEYATGELLATEHALLDDSGDGRGTELQIDYLTEAQGGRRRPGTAQPPMPKGDGKVSREVILELPESIIRPESPPAPPLPIEA